LDKGEWDLEHFSNYSSQYKKIEQIIWVIDIIELGLYVIIAIFIVSISVIIYSIIWNFIYYFKNEIYITRLVWWSKVFIYWPFAIQWAIYSFLSFFLSFFIFILIIQNINSLSTPKYFLDYSSFVIFIEFVIFVLIWWLSWFLSARKYLK
jgi:cell division protein FtsX